MRILITNDDGINAPGLKTLRKIAETLAGAAGDVWTVAPSTERSGVAHAISLSSPVLISQLGPRSFSIDGYPADCVLAGLHHILKGSPPDIILSGVNRGNNSAENALYSGTLGAAIEGALQGVVARVAALAAVAASAVTGSPELGGGCGGRGKPLPQRHGTEAVLTVAGI